MGTKIPDSRTEASAERARASVGKVRNNSGEIGTRPAEGAVRNGPAGSVKASGSGKNSGAGNPAAAFPKKAVFSGRENSPTVSNLSQLNSFPHNAASGSVESSGGKTVFAREVFRQFAASLGFPQDALSITLLAFCRFFSLSPNSMMMGTLRRELLASGKASSPGTAGEKAALEAEALGIVAALDKGVVLSPEALVRYARCFGSPEESAGFWQGGGAPPDDGGDDPPERTPDRAPEREEIPGLEELRAIAEEQIKKDKLLGLLNSLPGKNGQYWTVFPFKITVKGTELKVFIRLLKRELFCAGEDEYVIADIAGPKRQWRCFLGKNDGKMRADIRVYPGLSPGALKSLRKEAERFLGETGSLHYFRGFEEILVRNGEEVSSWVEDLCAESLPSVNKEV